MYTATPRVGHLAAFPVLVLVLVLAVAVLVTPPRRRRS